MNVIDAKEIDGELWVRSIDMHKAVRDEHYRTKVEDADFIYDFCKRFGFKEQAHKDFAYHCSKKLMEGR